MGEQSFNICKPWSEAILSIICPRWSLDVDPHSGAWAFKSPMMTIGTGSWERRLVKVELVREKDGGMYRLHREISLPAKWILTAVASRFVDMGISSYVRLLLMKVATPPDALSEFSLSFLRTWNPLSTSLSEGFRFVSCRARIAGLYKPMIV